MQDDHQEYSVVTAKASRRFAQSAEEVFDAWVNPERIKGWFAPGLGDISHVVVNPAVGGGFTIIQQREDGAAELVGQYQQVIHPRRLIFTLTELGDVGEDRMVVDISPQPHGCEVMLSYEIDAEYAEFIEDAELTWSVMLAAMAEELDAADGEED